MNILNMKAGLIISVKIILNNMKNKYEISDNYVLRLENETLRERLAEIQDKLDKIQKLLDGKKTQERSE